MARPGTAPRELRGAQARRDTGSSYRGGKGVLFGREATGGPDMGYRLPGMRAREGGFEVVGTPERWVLEGRDRGCLRGGASDEKVLEDGTVRRDEGWEKEIQEGGGGHRGAEISGQGQLGEGDKLGMGNSGGEGSKIESHRGWAGQRRGVAPVRSAERCRPQVPAQRGPLPPPAQWPQLRSSAASQPGTSRAKLPAAAAPSPPPRAGPRGSAPAAGGGRGGAS